VHTPIVLSRPLRPGRYPLRCRDLPSAQAGRRSDLGVTSNQVWGLTKTDQEWAEKLETALTAARRDDLKHGTNAAYVHGCVCHECREHQSIRMGRKQSAEQGQAVTVPSSAAGTLVST
jgi:hypothetical protein